MAHPIGKETTLHTYCPTRISENDALEKVAHFKQTHPVLSLKRAIFYPDLGVVIVFTQAQEAYYSHPNLPHFQKMDGRGQTLGNIFSIRDSKSYISFSETIGANPAYPCVPTKPEIEGIVGVIELAVN